MSEMHLTHQGFSLMAQAIGGAELCFTRVQFGDSKVEGSVIEPDATEQFEFTDLINPHPLELPIVKIRPSTNGTCSLTFLIDNTHLETGFYARELGVFAKVGDGAEQLYAYLHYGNAQAEWVPSILDEAWSIQVTIAIAVENAANVTAVLDTSLSYVTIPDFTEHINSPNPHPNLIQRGSSIESAEYLWASGGDSSLDLISVADIGKQILGDTSTVAQLNSRLNQAEANLANVYTQLNARDEMGLQGNLLLIEDFKDLDTVDLYKVKVIVAVEGVSDLELQTDNGIQAGAYYTLSDGIRSEEVQIKALAKNTGKFVATLFDTIKETYDLNCTYLYRTTAQISNGKAVGAGDITEAAYEFDEVWQGVSANASANLSMNLKRSNAAAFDLSGDYAFTSNYEFTLA